MGDTDFLAVKPSWRKNLDGGCVLKRTFRCDTGSSVGARIFPIAVFPPLIRSRIGAGELLFPWYTKNNIARPLKFALKKMNIPDARRYTSKEFRRGGALRKSSNPAVPLTSPNPQVIGCATASAVTWTSNLTGRGKFHECSSP